MRDFLEIVVFNIIKARGSPRDVIIVVVIIIILPDPFDWKSNIQYTIITRGK